MNHSVASSSTKSDLVSRQWSRFLISRSYLAIVLNILAAIAVWYFVSRHQIVTMSQQTYWWRFILLPSAIMLGLNLLVDVLVRSGRLSKRMEEYLSMLLLLFFCLFLAIIHKIAPVLLATFALPILISTVYANISLTRSTSFLALIMMGFAAYYMSLS